ncbi:metallophosphoesterase family protein [Janthinobacterium aquaticum]|uniref:metallophosphoesterase family protein n=1 Tax=Janthinobacterium sp. FT58W TaxID=2654254 RepID=UPI00126468DF|nr:metallophosphoesterase family protein [Janthinobacterium sp. FT58W]KAB8036651.1 metallophosphoesterase [Janthinobacterium sp. FT58W]
MRTIVHLSDLHFGKVDQQLLAPLRKLVDQLEPHVVVVSGDLTQRARSAEFKDARGFLDHLPGPQIIVPGNHDVPLYNIFSRFLTPLVKYQRYVTDDLSPEYIDDEVAVLGINTARSLTFKDGRISHEQIAALRARLAALPEGLTRIIVTHHPFDLPENFDKDDLVDRAPQALQMFSECGVDLLLAGHLHASVAGNTSRRYKIDGYAALMVQAGTATSTRGRGESNSFNVLKVENSAIRVERYSWNEERADFEKVSTEAFERRGGVWASTRPL